jgi:hypothetical protein
MKTILLPLFEMSRSTRRGSSFLASPDSRANSISAQAGWEAEEDGGYGPGSSSCFHSNTGVIACF